MRSSCRFRFVPIAIGTRQYEALEGLGRAIGEVAEKRGHRVLLLASSDMNHYESDAITRAKDQKAIDRILALDPRGLYEVVIGENVITAMVKQVRIFATAVDRPLAGVG